MLNSSWLLAIPWPAPAWDGFLLCSTDCFYAFWLWPLWWVEDAISRRFHSPFYKMYDKSIFIGRFLFLKSVSKRYLLKWFCERLSVFNLLFHSPAYGCFLRAEVIYSSPGPVSVNFFWACFTVVFTWNSQKAAAFLYAPLWFFGQQS